ncbi:MAG: serine hydrolase domain-containing protein [Mycoplasmatota bacterium]
MSIKDEVKTLTIRQNNTNIDAFKDLFTTDEYTALIEEAFSCKDSKNPYYKLIKRSNLEEETIKTIRDLKLSPSIVLNFGTRNKRFVLCKGSKEEYTLVNNRKTKTNSDVSFSTIYELASTSKLFTTISFYQINETLNIDLDKPIKEYCEEFKFLDNVSINDLLNFRKPLNISVDEIDFVKNIEELKKLIYNSKEDYRQVDRAYNDVGPIILSFVFESITGRKLSDHIDEFIIKQLNLKNTFLFVPEEHLEDVASNNFNKKISNGEIIESYNEVPGNSHDSKSKIIKDNLKTAPGHAGYFSSVPDLVALGYALIDNLLISKRNLEKFSTFDSQLDGNISGYFSSLAYLKQPNNKFLTVPFCLSGKAFCQSGFSGTNLIIDPLNDIVIAVGANRLHNRVWMDDKTINYDDISCIPFSRKREELETIMAKLSIQFNFIEKLEEKQLIKK